MFGEKSLQHSKCPLKAKEKRTLAISIFGTPHSQFPPLCIRKRGRKPHLPTRHFSVRLLYESKWLRKWCRARANTTLADVKRLAVWPALFTRLSLISGSAQPAPPHKGVPRATVRRSHADCQERAGNFYLVLSAGEVKTFASRRLVTNITRLFPALSTIVERWPKRQVLVPARAFEELRTFRQTWKAQEEEWWWCAPTESII